MASNSTSVVLAAMIANGAIAVLKFGGFLLTGSAAMLSETYHSISDTGNQVFLLIGIFYGRKQATQRHPFGYGKAQFFFSFLVSVMLFGIAGWESAKHGISALTSGGSHAGGHPFTLPVVGATVDPIYVNYTVLLGAIAFESYAFRKAYTEMRRQIDVHEWSGFREAFRKTSDVTTLTALTEDTIALAGAVVAIGGIALAQITGNRAFDAVSALVIGIMLMGFAVALAWENKRLLLGESLPAVEERRLRQIVADWPTVTHVEDFRTVYFGPEHIIVTADVAFDSDLDTDEMDAEITAIEQALTDSEPSVQKVYVEPEI
jgi:cation diffusion facilitator family transporter